MQDEVTTWRAVPPVLYAWFVLEVAYTAIQTVVFHQMWFGPRILLVWAGIGMASGVCATFGSFELASRLTGTARLGAQVAAWSNLGMLLLELLLGTYFEVSHHVPHWLVQVDTYLWFGIDLAIAIGWTLAALRYKALAAAAITVAAICGLPYEVYDGLFRIGAGSWLHSALVAMHVLALGALVVASARGRAHVDPVRAQRGLRMIAGSMQFRVVAGVLGAVALAMAAASTGEAGIGLIKAGLLGAAAIGLIAHALFVWGLLDATRAAVPELPRWLLVPAGAGTAWTAGVAFRQLVALYHALYGSDVNDAMDVIQALTVPQLAAMSVALILVVIAIGIFAQRRGDAAASIEVSGRGATAIVLWLISAAVTTWLVPTAKSSGAGAIYVVLSVGAMLAAMLLFAGLCRRAAGMMTSGAALPGARVVR